MKESKSFWGRVPRWVRWVVFGVITIAVLVPLGIFLAGYAAGRDVIIVKPEVDKIDVKNKELKDEKGTTLTTADMQSAVALGKSILKKLELN